jgi:predicted alpha/beta superfamily hydrolase
MKVPGYIISILALAAGIRHAAAQQITYLDDYKISIALPEHYDASKTAYPVLYVTDANSNFAAAAQVTKKLQHDKTLPPMIVVGIGYRTDSLAKILRLRDMTPDYDPALRRSHAGKSAAFLRFIKEQLMPYIKKNYRASADAGYAGTAIGGVFGLYVLFHEPQIFRHYLIVSPSIWYDSAVIFKYEHQYAQTHHDLFANVYLSAGELEESQAAFTHMETNLKKLAATLKNRHYPALRIKTQLLKEETHFSVLPAALGQGLVELYRQ